MTTRESVHGIVDRLSEDRLDEAARLLSHLAQTDDDLRRILDNLPEEDEELSPREVEAVLRYKAGIRTGRVYTEAEVMALIDARARE